MRLMNRKIVASLCALWASSAVMADDAVGVFRVDVTNDAAAIALPFVPFGSGALNDFLSGAFVGDESVADRVYRMSAGNGSMTNAVFVNGAWIDPSSGGRVKYALKREIRCFWFQVSQSLFPSMSSDVFPPSLRRALSWRAAGESSRTAILRLPARHRLCRRVS